MHDQMVLIDGYIAVLLPVTLLTVLFKSAEVF